jgi:hypothetical protein
MTTQQLCQQMLLIQAVIGSHRQLCLLSFKMPPDISCSNASHDLQAAGKEQVDSDVLFICMDGWLAPILRHQHELVRNVV